MKNYSGNVYWELSPNSTTNSYNWNEYAYQWTLYGSNNYSSNLMNLSTQLKGILENGDYILCARLSAGIAVTCVNIIIYLEPISISIISPSNNSIINNPLYSNNFIDYLKISATVKNYTGNIYWNSSHSDDNSNNSFQNWTDYVYSNSNSSSISDQYRRVGFGNITICASLSNIKNAIINPNSVLSDCINIFVIPRIAEVSIISYDNLLNSNNSDIDIEYYSNNHSWGQIIVNGNIISYLGYKYTTSQNNNSIQNNTISNNSNFETYSINKNYFNYGSNSICIEVTSEDDILISDCIIINVPYPQVGINILNPTNNTNFYH